MRKTILILVLICLALLVVSCAPGEIGPGKAIAGAQQPDWVKFYQCYEKQGGKTGRYDFFYLKDSNCFGHTMHAEMGYISKTQFPGSVLLSECERVKIEEIRNIFRQRTGEIRYPDKFVIQGRACPPGTDFSHELGYAYANKVEGTSALYRCWADRWSDGVWDHWLSFNPNCPSTRTKDTKQEGIYGWVPRQSPLPTAMPPVKVSGPSAGPVTCDQLKRQCDEKFDAEKEGCERELEKAEQECRDMERKIEGLRKYIREMQQANEEHSNLITGGAVAAQPQNTALTTGCPPEKAAEIKAECAEQIESIRRECNEKLEEIKSKECKDLEAEYNRLLGIIRKVQGLLEK